MHICTVVIDTSASREPRCHTGAGRDDPELAFDEAIFTPHPDGPEYGSPERLRTVTAERSCRCNPLLRQSRWRSNVNESRGEIPINAMGSPWQCYRVYENEIFDTATVKKR
jgi:hypothetical protein